MRPISHPPAQRAPARVPTLAHPGGAAYWPEERSRAAATVERERSDAGGISQPRVGAVPQSAGNFHLAGVPRPSSPELRHP